MTRNATLIDIAAMQALHETEDLLDLRCGDDSDAQKVVHAIVAAVAPLIRAAALEEAATWQTIENAPANTTVLVGCWLSANRWFQIVAEKVPAEADNWIADSGRITLKPTHWQLLPPPPSADSA